jgi:membrane carboxypeptidase/penicillin-binding protein PbpC
VRLLDLTGAYGAFAANGVLQPASVITGVDGTGACACFGQWARPASRRVMTAETAWLITDMLSDDAARGPGFGRESVLNLRTGPGQAAAVKTGTTPDFRDNWTIGYTPDVVVGVWVGNADNRPMRQISGITGAAPLWREVLSGLLEMRSSRAFEMPKNLVQVELCAESAAPASEACPAQWLSHRHCALSSPTPAS